VKTRVWIAGTPFEYYTKDPTIARNARNAGIPITPCVSVHAVLTALRGCSARAVDSASALAMLEQDLLEAADELDR